MKQLVDESLKLIFKSIVDENKTDAEWASIESDDMFQSEAYIGGYDADEGAFCFSYYHKGTEFWFQVTLSEVEKILQGDLTEIELLIADT